MEKEECHKMRILVSNNGDHGLEDVPEYTLIEFAYYKMALEAGVQMNECRFFMTGREIPVRFEGNADRLEYYRIGGDCCEDISGDRRSID